jgi:cytoskeletal protein RodZ
MGVLAVLVALVLGGLWLREHRKEAAERLDAFRHLSEKTQPQQPPSNAQAQPLPSNTVTIPDTPSAAAPSSTIPSTVPAPGATDAAATPTPAPVAPPATTPTEGKPAGTAAAPLSTPSAADGATGSAPVEISITAKARAWISVRSDGKPVETVTLDPASPAHSVRKYKAQEKLLLVMGNPAGLTVSYNGKPAGELGEEGKRATITFTPEGIERQ